MQRNARAVKNLSPDEIEEGKALAVDSARPKTRGDCVSGPRPCPWVACKYHLLLNIGKAGHFLHTGHGKEVDRLDEMRETCALDIADQGGVSSPEVAELLGLTSKGVYFIEERALLKLRRRLGGNAKEALRKLAREGKQ